MYIAHHESPRPHLLPQVFGKIKLGTADATHRPSVATALSPLSTLLAQQRFSDADRATAGDDYHLCIVDSSGLTSLCMCFSNIYRGPWNEACQHLQYLKLLTTYGGDVGGAAAEAELALEQFLPHREQQRTPSWRQDPDLLSQTRCVDRIIELCELCQEPDDKTASENDSCTLASREFACRLEDPDAGSG